MPTLVRKTMRRARRLFQRIEPVAILFSYLAAGVMAVCAWFFPLVSASYLPHSASVIEGALLLTGSVLCIIGHLRKKEILEVLGLISIIAGTYVFLSILINLWIVVGYVPIVQVVFMTLGAMGFMWSRAFKTADDIFNLRLELTPRRIHKIYEMK